MSSTSDANALECGDPIRLAHLDGVVEYSADAIISSTLDGTIRLWNGAATRLFGYTASEAIGQSVTLIVPPDLQAEERAFLEKIRNGERIDRTETIRLSADGQRIPIRLTLSPVRDARGAIIGASRVAWDLSERRRAGGMQAAETLLEANRRMAEFMAFLAHELRNPLAPIRYALAAIKKSDSTAEQRKRSEEIIERQAVHMSRLLDLLLDASSITRGKLELRKCDVELTAVLGTAIEAVRPLLDAKQHTLSLRLPTQAVRLTADPVRLAQVFSNLLINAAKYTDAGGHIELRAAQFEDHIIVSLRDNGIGISTQMMPKLFTMFAQDPLATSRSEGGLGIGLALAHGMVTLHGGHIEARSEGPGLGSEFLVRLPSGASVGNRTQKARDPGTSTTGAGLRVLIVDDNRDAADSCAILLRLSGHHVQTAYSGQQVLEISGSSQPQVILADIGLPDLDGYALAQRIRATPWGRSVTLIAISGWGQDEDRRRAMEAGFDSHLTKPIEPQTIESLLQSLEVKLNSSFKL